MSQLCVPKGTVAVSVSCRYLQYSIVTRVICILEEQVVAVGVALVDSVPAQVTSAKVEIIKVNLVVRLTCLGIIFSLA